MKIWVLAVCCAVMVCAMVLIVLGKRRDDKEALYVRKLRGTLLYRELASQLRPLGKKPLDMVLIEKDRIVIRGICPPEVVLNFRLTENGFRCMNETRTRAMALLLAEEFRQLDDPRKYRMRGYRITRSDGMKDKGWEYVARTAYKACAISEYEQYLLSGPGNGSAELHRFG